MADNKKTCIICGKTKNDTEFFKTENLERFPDGRQDTCKTCVAKNVNMNDLSEFMGLLKELDRPYIDTAYDATQAVDKPSIGKYLQKISVLKQFKGLKYKDSVGIDLEDIEKELENVAEINEPHTFDSAGNLITITPAVKKRWEFIPDKEIDEILFGERYIADMKLDYKIETVQEERTLLDLAQLEILKQQLMNDGIERIKDLDTVSKQIALTLKDAGLRIIDRKDNLQKTGIDSIGEIILQIERDKGFILPNQVEFEPDDVDYMLMYYMQWVQQNFKQEAKMISVDEKWREDVDFENHNVVEIDAEANANYDEKENSKKEPEEMSEIAKEQKTPPVDKIYEEIADEIEDLF